MEKEFGNDFYEEVEESLENDEISPQEEAFMKGYSSDAEI